jgi:hypothetical protein
MTLPGLLLKAGRRQYGAQLPGTESYRSEIVSIISTG